MVETLFVLIIISSIGMLYTDYKLNIQMKNLIISEIIYTQFQSILYQSRYDFHHDLVNQSIWFNKNGNVNQANTINIMNSNQYFTIMLYTGRIHE
jgi:hypothetical protein